MGAENGGGNGGIWKWVAAILFAVLLAGSPAIVQAITAPSQEEVDFIRERQVQVLIRLSAIETRLESQADLIAELRRELQEHELLPK